MLTSRALLGAALLHKISTAGFDCSDGARFLSVRLTSLVHFPGLASEIYHIPTVVSNRLRGMAGLFEDTRNHSHRYPAAARVIIPVASNRSEPRNQRMNESTDPVPPAKDISQIRRPADLDSSKRHYSSSQPSFKAFNTASVRELTPILEKMLLR